MRNIKKTLLVCGILSLVATIFSIGEILLDLFVYETYVVYFVFDCIGIPLSIVTGVLLIVLSTKSDRYIIDHRIIVDVLCWLNILNNFFVWFIVFWADLYLSRRIRYEFVKQRNETDISLQQDQYKFETKASKIKTELDELDQMRKAKQITEQEYAKLREDIINKNL